LYQQLANTQGCYKHSQKFLISDNLHYKESADFQLFLIILSGLAEAGHDHVFRLQAPQRPKGTSQI